MSTPVVRTKLKIDNEASPALAKIKGDFAEAGKAADSAQQHATDFAKGAAGAFVGMNLGPAIHSIYDFGKGFLDAATAGDAADTAVAGMITTVQGIPWGQAKKQAQGFGDDLDDISVKAGVAGNDVGNAFQAMIELRGATGAGMANAVSDVTKISTIAGVLGKSSEGMAREFSFMSEGVVKTKGQLFQLLQTTGIFGKSTKKAAEYWASLTEESRIKALDFGLSKVADSMGKAAPSAKQLMTSVEDLYDMTKERLGEPLMNELVPVLQEVKKNWAAAIPDIEKFGRTMSHDVADAVKFTVKEAKEAFQYLVDHHEEIRQAISEGVDKAKAIVDFILAHKEEIALAFGAKMAAPALGVAGKIGGAVMDIGEKGIGGIGMAGGAGGAASVAAFSAAVIGLGLAVDQWRKLMDETGGGKSEGEQDQAARKANFAKMTAAPDAGAWSPAQQAGFDALRKAYVDGATAIGEDSRAAGELADKAYQAHAALRATVVPVEQAADAIQEMTIAAQFYPEQADQMAAQTDTAVAAIASSFMKASVGHDAAAEGFIANLLTKSTDVQKAFLMSADMTAEGFDELAKLVEGGASGFADKLREIGGAKAKGGAASPAAPKIQMTGGQTFNIAQNFRDGDPDRILVSFQDDVTKFAERRVQSGMSMPFGG